MKNNALAFANIVSRVSLTVFLVGGASAETLTSEPRGGAPRAGQHILVDDGTCPSGSVKEVIGGSNLRLANGERVPGSKRNVHCIRR